MPVEALGREAFLLLLTKQLQFQDPLKPMDSTEFVSQLAQFRALESAIQTNEKLDSLVQGAASMNNMGTANLLGRRVEIAGGKMSHQSGQAEKVLYQLDADAQSVVINVLNEGGAVVKTLSIQGPLGKGANQVLWDGTDNQGNSVSGGVYTYIGSAKENDGKLTPVNLSVAGEVTGVSYEEGGPFVMINGTSVPVVRITRVIK